MKTIFIKPNDAERKWFLIDAEGKALGRVAAKAAAILRGKEKAIFAPHHELGDYLVLVNADKAAVSGRKYEKKLYHHHTGFPGGLKTQTYRKLLERHPTAPMEAAIRGMLPKGPLGRKIFGNVKIYAGGEHPHAAQNPEKIDV
ncbi:MAG: 50S ribosomal protein L13 [Spirochaetaceae bacterium]|jgi:large subunit ribosomal protein L13|nr:50S ribosomal protein L13 [Spirochaetaceae bacterium]